MSGNNVPWGFDEARDACRRAAVAQEHAEQALRVAAREFAVAEERYRVALAKRIVELRADGEAATVCADLARGTKEVAGLRRTRDIAEGVYKAMEHAAWRHTANRRDAARFADWSMRRELAEQGVGGEQPRWGEAA